MLMKYINQTLINTALCTVHGTSKYGEGWDMSQTLAMSNLKAIRF